MSFEEDFNKYLTSFSKKDKDIYNDFRKGNGVITTYGFEYKNYYAIYKNKLFTAEEHNYEINIYISEFIDENPLNYYLEAGKDIDFDLGNLEDKIKFIKENKNIELCSDGNKYNIYYEDDDNIFIKNNNILEPFKLEKLLGLLINYNITF